MRKTMKKALALVLAGAMVMAMGVSTFAEEAEAKAAPEGTITKEAQADGTVVVTLSAKGDVTEFNFGITYDSSKLKVKKTTWEADFLEDYVGSGESTTAKTDFKDYGYVVIAGTGAFDLTPERLEKYSNFDGVIATVTFEGEASAFSLVVEPKQYKDKIDAAGDPAPIITVVPKEEIKVELPEVEAPTATPDPGAEDDKATATPDPGAEDDKATATPAPGSDDKATATPAPGSDDKATATPAPKATATPVPSDKAADTADTASIVIPMIAICGAAAAVVVASKKRVEE